MSNICNCHIPLAVNINGNGNVYCNFSFVLPESISDTENNKDKDMSKAKVDQPVDLRKKYEPDQTASSSVTEPVVRMDNTYDRISKDMTTSTEDRTVETRQRNAEYESDSDDENLSVISGTISITSDSEEDENFVVVPMPPCFMCDMPVDNSSKFFYLGVFE
jgi:hypothetical protein